jgi:beta-N-acetylhexosaminidase
MQIKSSYKEKKMIKKVLIGVLLFVASVQANVSLEHKIGQMLMVGFYGTSAPEKSQICQDIRRYHIGAVILFDYNPVNRQKAKNIVSKAQLKQLTSELQACSYDGKLLIAVDQEGGRVQRLKSKYGFYGHFPKASDVAKMNQKQIAQTYLKMSKELKGVGINYDLAPVVDLDINQRNHVIHGLGRSFGKSPELVASYASSFIDAMHHYGVLTALKHFPGHGSSEGDTHKGYVDVTQLWQSKELQPYKLLNKKADTVMVAHVYNRHLDANYPATLSKKTINGLLRKKLGFNGVVITDDLQMGAIRQKYSVEKTLELAINAGNDILLIGNQLDPKRTQSPHSLVSTIETLVTSHKVDVKRLTESYQRIQALKKRL